MCIERSINRKNCAEPKACTNHISIHLSQARYKHVRSSNINQVFQIEYWLLLINFRYRLPTITLYICMKQNWFSRNMFTQSSKTTFARFKMNLDAQDTAILMINLNLWHTLLSTMKIVINLYQFSPKCVNKLISIFTQMRKHL
jgi:hypothetical protein